MRGNNGPDAFRAALQAHYPEAVPLPDFVAAVHDELATHGLGGTQAMALAAQCRDELCQPLLQLVGERWGDWFSVGSLAGMVLCGRTGFNAAVSHAPCDAAGAARLVVWGGPHIAIDASGAVGQVQRDGRPAPGAACGSLLALRAALQRGCVPFRQGDDWEQAMVAQRVLDALPHPDPSLPELTQAALAAIHADLQHHMATAPAARCSRYAIVAGTLVHAPGGRHFVAPVAVAVYDQRPAGPPAAPLDLLPAVLARARRSYPTGDEPPQPVPRAPANTRPRRLRRMVAAVGALAALLGMALML